MTPSMPSPARGFYFDQFWQHVQAGHMHLQYCDACALTLYPPAPACPRCLSMALLWAPVSGQAKVTSCARFHRSYLPEYPAPHTVLAVRLQEGPTFVTTMETSLPLAELMGMKVAITYKKFDNGAVLPVAVPENNIEQQE